MDKIDEILARKEELKKLEEENVRKYTEVLNRIFSTDDGKFFYNALCKMVGIYDATDIPNNEMLRENIGAKKVILRYILPFLAKDVRRKLYE